MKGNKSEPSVVIVIPIYQAEISVTEEGSLKQCIDVLGKYAIKIVKPRGLNLDHWVKKYPLLDLVSFADDYFLGTAGYNRLMTTISFYEVFRSFDFMLIYQLDAYVFRDELINWCKKGFDYIGAPSLHQEAYDKLQGSSKQIYADALSSNRVVYNGGLSLRKISSIIRYLKIYNRAYSPWKGNEDMLFSQEATRLIPMKLFLKLPDWQTALRFAFEKSPAATFELTDKHLPFACHAWERYDPEFWSPYIVIKQ